MKRLFLLLPLSLILTSCAAYENTVDSRSIGVAGYAKDENQYGGQVQYTVHYR